MMIRITNPAVFRAETSCLTFTLDLQDELAQRFCSVSLHPESQAFSYLKPEACRGMGSQTLTSHTPLGQRHGVMVQCNKIPLPINSPEPSSIRVMSSVSTCALIASRHRVVSCSCASSSSSTYAPTSCEKWDEMHAIDVLSILVRRQTPRCGRTSPITLFSVSRAVHLAFCIKLINSRLYNSGSVPGHLLSRKEQKWG